MWCLLSLPRSQQLEQLAADLRRVEDLRRLSPAQAAKAWLRPVNGAMPAKGQAHNINPRGGTMLTPIPAANGPGRADHATRCA